MTAPTPARRRNLRAQFPKCLTRNLLGLALIAAAAFGGHPPRVATAAPAPVAPALSTAGRLREAPSMLMPRAAHTATTLFGGRVLIVGGFSLEEGQLAGAELFDPRADRFQALAPPRVPRQSHTATRLRDGRVLLAGGYGAGGRPVDSAELFDPATGSFTLTGRMFQARASHEAVPLDDGRVLLVGGAGPGWTFLAGAELFDPATGRFSATGDMAEPREGHAAVRLADGRVLVTGGHRGRGAATVISRTAEIFDAVTGRFRPTGAMVLRRHKHDAVALLDGRVLLLGGTDERDSGGVYAAVEMFRPDSGRFEAAPGLRLGRYKHRGTTFLRAGGTLLLVGGAPQAEAYEPRDGAGVLVGGDARMAGQFSAAAELPDGRILVTGGYGQGRGPRADAWLYEPGISPLPPAVR